MRQRERFPDLASEASVGQVERDDELALRFKFECDGVLLLSKKLGREL